MYRICEINIISQPLCTLIDLRDSRKLHSSRQPLRQPPRVVVRRSSGEWWKWFYEWMYMYRVHTHTHTRMQVHLNWNWNWDPSYAKVVSRVPTTRPATGVPIIIIVIAVSKTKMYLYKYLAKPGVFDRERENERKKEKKNRLLEL